MPIQTDSLRSELLAVLDENLDVVARGDVLAVLTPCDYHDGDGVVVQISRAEGGFVVSDGGNGDARLLVGGPGARAIGPLGVAVCRRFGAAFDAGRVLARAEALVRSMARAWSGPVAASPGARRASPA